ncbi:MAG: PIG-L deacetylase family protein [Acidimicrobiales bacterium]|nr:PIG-L deacetylase family protein [Acidimicrobiales bacterium]
MTGALPDLTGMLVVCAHPDDESFGVGALIHAFATGGTEVTILCFTHGEASTLHGIDGDLTTIRAAELAAASDHLGVAGVHVLDYPDGALADQPRDALVDHVVELATDVDAEGLLVFDHGGITGHPDHQAATDAALAAADMLDLRVLAWAIPAQVAATLNQEFDTTFVGRNDDECHLTLEVDRTTQFAAIECHTSQSADNPVLRRRLLLQHDTECLRFLR